MEGEMHLNELSPRKGKGAEVSSDEAEFRHQNA